MWKFNKLTLFILVLLMSTCAGITIYMINWEVFENGKGIFREIHLPLIFLGLAFYFMVSYVKRLKESENK